MIGPSALGSRALESERLESTYRANFGALVKVAFLLTGSRAEAQDAVHEAFLRCAPKLATVDHAPSYLRAAVVNECRARYRRSKRRRPPDIRADEHLPHDLIETRDALAVLSERKRAVIVLRYFVDLPDDQIAAELGCRPATVRSLAHRALKELRKELS